MAEIKVGLKERSYSVHVVEGSLDMLPQLVGSFVAGRRVLVVSDDKVSRIYSGKVVSVLSGISSSVSSFDFPAGEESKNMSTLEKIYRFAASSGIDRKSVIVALGGGVPGDVAGFAAATYMRGIDFIQIPTTLLAMVDSSVGGKTAVDLPEGKNLVGAFWQPKVVVADPGTLKTLPVREIRCGLAEVVKYGVIMDPDFFSFLENNVEKINLLEMEIMSEIISRCCRLKAQVVAGDEREETGLRAILNYGHTFGHAIETVTEYGKYQHGEAVAIGMAVSAKFAVSSGVLKSVEEERIVKLLNAFSLPVSTGDIAPERLLSAMKKDKKVSGGKIKLVLPEKIGRVSIVDGDETAILRSLEDSQFYRG